MRNPALQRMNLSLEDYHQVVRESMALHRLELIEQRADWIRRVERWIQGYFIHGYEVNTTRIQPTLELVTTDRQHEIWRYCRLRGSIPYNRGCGRLLRYLLRDVGQPNAPLMGIIALSSPVLISRPRDTWIGWQYPRDVDLKRRKLPSCMDLTVSMAIPPYNHLTAGKMVCLAVLSNEVRQDYWNKFHAVETPTHIQEGRLALITTTSLYGSSVQYNRLNVDGRRAYELVGYTSGFGNAHLTESQFAAMEQYLKDIGKPIPKGWGTGRSYRLRVFSSYYRNYHKERHAPAHEHARSIYMAPLAHNTCAFLQGVDDNLVPYDWSLDHLVTNWRNRWLMSRLDKTDVMARFRATDPATGLLSHELAATGIQKAEVKTVYRPTVLPQPQVQLHASPMPVR